MALMTKVGMEFIARDRSRAGMMSLSSNITSLNRRFFTLGRTLLTVAGIGGFGYMIKKQMEVIDVTAKMSDRLNISTQGLIGLQHGAKIMGVQTETLNKSLEIFSRRLGEVDMGIGQARYSLDKLGLQYEDLIGLRTDEAFKVVADRISGLATQAEKAAAANYLFGRSGQQLLNLMELGAEGVEKFRIEAEKLGLAFSRIDAAKVEAANDALTRVRAVFTGLFRSAVIELAPYIESAADAFVDFATRGQGVGDNVVNVFESIALSISAVITETESLAIALGKLSSPMDHIRKVSEANKKAIEQYRAVTKDVQAFTHPGGPLSAPVQPRDPMMFKVIQDVQRQAAGLVPADRQSEIIAAFEKIRRDAEQRAEIAANQAAAGATSADVAGPPVPADLEERQRALEQMKMEISFIEHKFAEVSRSIEWSMSSAFQSMITDGASWRDATIGFLNDVAAAFAKMAADMVARAAMEAWIGPLLSGLSGGLSGYSPNYSTSVSNAGVAPVAAVVGHKGGMVGDIIESRMVPASVFSGARRMHDGGLLSDEVPVIAQKGERILRKGESPQSVINNITIQTIDTVTMESWVMRNKRLFVNANLASSKINSPSSKMQR